MTPWGHVSRHCVYCGKVGPRVVAVGGYAHRRCIPKTAKASRITNDGLSVLGIMQEFCDQLADAVRRQHTKGDLARDVALSTIEEFRTFTLECESAIRKALLRKA